MVNNIDISKERSSRVDAKSGTVKEGESYRIQPDKIDSGVGSPSYSRQSDTDVAKTTPLDETKVLKSKDSQP